MPGLRLEYWDREIALAITAKARRPVDIDVYTANLARVCVEVDLSKPLVVDCPVGSSEEETEFFQEFVYEIIGIYCY